MNYKLLIALILSLNIEAHSIKKTIKLIDHIHESQAYWELKAHDKKCGIWKRSPITWFFHSWKTKVSYHQKALAAQRSELINHLALLSEDPQCLSRSAITQLHAQTATILTEHGAPSHFKKYWISYAGVTVGAATIAFYLHRFKETHTLFIIPPQNKPLNSTLEDFSPFSGPQYSTDAAGNQYLQVKKSEEKRAEAFLTSNNVFAVKSSPKLSLYWYTKDGEHKINEFIRKHGTEPLQKIYSILKNEALPESKILTTDIKDNEKLYEETITTVLENALVVEQTTAIMHQELKGKLLKEISFPEKQRVFLRLTAKLGTTLTTQIQEIKTMLIQEDQKLHASKGIPFPDDGRLPEFIRRCIAEANDYKELGRSLGGEMRKYAHVVNVVSQEKAGFLGLLIQIVTTHAFELKLKEAAFTHIAQGIAQDAQLNIELSKTIPMALSIYLGYLATNSIYKHATALTVLTPLKTDLISLQLVLNKERYTKECAALSRSFKGECVYWIQRLHRYEENIPPFYRSTYRRYLTDLEDKTVLPEQKMTLITCLFHELDPLFRKG